MAYPETREAAMRGILQTAHGEGSIDTLLQQMADDAHVESYTAEQAFWEYSDVFANVGVGHLNDLYDTNGDPVPEWFPGLYEEVATAYGDEVARLEPKRAQMRRTLDEIYQDIADIITEDESK